jgi:LPXTG-motif cell wall-anchored protein
VTATSGTDPADVIDRSVWPAVRDEYGRLNATPGLIAAGLAALGLGGVVAARRRRPSRPRLLGVVEPRRLRRRKRRRKWLGRLIRR